MSSHKQGKSQESNQCRTVFEEDKGEVKTQAEM